MPDTQSPTNAAGAPISDTDAIADAAMTPVDDAAGGPTADKEQMDEPGEEEAAAQLGDFA